MAAAGEGERRFGSYGPIIILVIVISVLYSTMVLSAYSDLWAPSISATNDLKREAIRRLIALHLLLPLLLISLWRSAAARHEKVPNTWPREGASAAPADEEESEESAMIKAKHVHRPTWIEVKADGRQRFCRIKTCRIYKPDRTHHCSTCKQCVMGMDHHCPWIRNCVGFANRKFFFCLIFYSLATLVMLDVTMAEPMLRVLQQPRSQLNVLNFAILFSWFLGGFLTLLLSCFFLFHCWLIANGFTTLEFCEKRGSGAKHPEFYHRSPFDLGLYRNVCGVLGPYPLLWLLPVKIGMCACNEATGVCICGTQFEYNQAHPAVIAWRKLNEKPSA